MRTSAPPDLTHRIDDEGNGAEFPNGSFDIVIASDLLESVRRPEHILRKIRRWLSPDGNFLTSLRTVRSLPIVEGLLTGRWLGAAGKTDTRAPIRFYTRRKIEKLLFGTGFSIEALHAIADPRHDHSLSRGNAAQVQMGKLHTRGLAPADVEEFRSEGFDVQSSPSPDVAFPTTSIVIVTFNQIEFTRQCVDSIRRMTDEPYELIFVDNGSEDGTPEYLETIAGATVIRNLANRGFPAAANQGIAAAVGGQVLLLNNDTIVTTGWLYRLLQAMQSDPKIGLAGPCSNFVGSEQQVEINYSNLAGLDGFAWEWGKSHDREVAESSRLIGFCLLLRRAVVDEIGTLDERFGLGCLRGRRLLLARNPRCWLACHHRQRRVRASLRRPHVPRQQHRPPGNPARKRTEVPRQVARRTARRHHAAARDSTSPAATLANWRQRRTNLVLERTTGRGLLLRRQRIRLSLCMIARDSAATLRPCLASIRHWVDEIVVVDTGSKDDTPQIAQSFGGKLFHFPWCDDFSAAHNESLRHARGEWLFWMDSDDTIPPECGRRLRDWSTANAPDILGFVMQVHCPGGHDGTGADERRDTCRPHQALQKPLRPAVRRPHSRADPAGNLAHRRKRGLERCLRRSLRVRPEPRSTGAKAASRPPPASPGAPQRPSTRSRSSTWG